jgi:prepilin-type N-terminal cleavage/methylation domain-containing protein
MNVYFSDSRQHGSRTAAGFTLIEMMTASVVFCMVMMALVYTQIFGLRQDQLAQSKLGASDSSRRGFNQLSLDVRSAKIWSVGNGSSSSYTALTNGAVQQGNALQLSLTTDTNIYIRYYFETASGRLYRKRTGQSPSLICKDLTNTMYFEAEDHRGVVQTDLSHKGVIHVMLQFAQFQYPQTVVGTGYLYDFYKMEFRLTPHVPDGP